MTRSSCLLLLAVSLGRAVKEKTATKMSAAWARVYADVNTHKPREYWDYESHPIEWGYVCFSLFTSTSTKIIMFMCNSGAIYNNII